MRQQNDEARGPVTDNQATKRPIKLIWSRLKSSREIAFVYIACQNLFSTLSLCKVGIFSCSRLIHLTYFPRLKKIFNTNEKVNKAKRREWIHGLTIRRENDSDDLICRSCKVKDGNLMSRFQSLRLLTGVQADEPNLAATKDTD